MLLWIRYRLYSKAADQWEEKSLYLAACPQPCSLASDLGGESHYMIIIFSNAGSLESINLSIGCQNSDGENIDRQECYMMKFDCR